MRFFCSKNKILEYTLLGDKMDEAINVGSHSITINERKNLVITGVKKIDSFHSEEFLMDTTLGFLHIKGSELEIIKLDTYQGNVSIKGKIEILMYMDNGINKSKEETFLSKLFK